MRKKSFVNIVVVGAGNGVNAILGLLFFTIVARSLPIDEFGKYALLTSLLVSLTKIMDFGTNSLFVAKSITKPQDYINRFSFLKVLLFFVTLIVSTTALHFLNLYSTKTLLVFFVGALGYGLNITLFAYFQRLEKFVLAVMLNTIPALIKATFAFLVFFKLVSLNLTFAFSIFSFSILFSTLLVFFLPRGFLKFKFNTKVKEFFKEAFPAGISQIIKEGWPAIGNTLAKITNTFSGVGIFSLASKIADIFTLISLSIFTVLLPKNAHRKRAHKVYDVKETLVLGAGILVLAFVGMGVSNFLTVPIFGEKFSQSLGLINILILAAAITAIHSFMDNYFFVEEKTKTLMQISIAKLLTYVVLSLSLTKLLSLTGLAYANLVSAVFALTCTLGVIYKGRKA